MDSKIFFLIIIIGAWGIVSYYFWFVWRRAKLKSYEEAIELDLKQSLPCPKLQLEKRVICLDRDKPVKEAIFNMRDPKKLGKRKYDPKGGIGSVVITGRSLNGDILTSSDVIGIVTLRDIVKGAYEQCYEGKTLLTRKCGDIMSQDYMIASEDAILDDCWQVLSAARRQGVEHILVEKDNQIRGLVTDKDIFRAIEFEPR